MQKQRKKNPNKKEHLKFKGLKLNKIKRLKGLVFLRKIFKRNLATKMSIKFTKRNIRKLKHAIILNLRVGANNMFCNLSNKKGKTLLKSVSTGYYKMKASKKNIRFYVKDLIKFYLKELTSKKVRFPKAVCIRVTAPIKLRKQIISLLKTVFIKRFLRKKLILLEVAPLKVFNGCRAKKQKKKKRKTFTLYKPL